MIDYNEKKFHIDVLEVKPDMAISVVETDVNVDFATPKDYKEPDYKAEAAAKAAEAAAKLSAEAGTRAEAGGSGAAQAAEAEPEQEAKFMVFGGALPSYSADSKETIRPLGCVSKC